MTSNTVREKGDEGKDALFKPYKNPRNLYRIGQIQFPKCNSPHHIDADGKDR